MSAPIKIERARTVKALRAQVAVWRGHNLRIALVPTMGSLHEGHLSLVRLALENADRVVVSIFVNPAQFAPHEDFESYPRTEDADCAKLAASGAHLAYIPRPEEMYAPDASTRVRVGGISQGLCGDSRPHFFEGVATVVCKLFLQCLPDVAVFGEKDYQQLLVIRRMVRDLSLPVEILGGPIVREADGLAMSSRNAYLTPEERRIAGALNAILAQMGRDLRAGKGRADVIAAGRARLKDAGFSAIDYLELRDAETLDPVSDPRRSARVFAAVWMGRTRLIDNMPVD